ncbi:periodic tryptophan protein 1 homolog [Watersipora subatra]|uniref:periodic tryptophan protein 1 homolog n=1 Tax=Watersipora subatra TaxID=2589382 RepID=UPI00355B4EC2
MASLVSSLCWVNRGVAKTRPEKLILKPSELKNVINELKGTSTSGDEDLEETLPHKPVQNAPIDKEESSSSELEERDEDPDDPYNLAAYDDEDQDEEHLLESTIAGMTVYADNKDDPYITLPDEADEDEDKEDFEIKPSDNLIVAGRAAPECSILEVYVYNQEASNLYCHHDIILPAFPLATCWVNYDVETKSPGNLVAVGSMEPVISLWELDVVEVIEPIATLGTKPKRSSKKKKTKQDSPLSGHTDAVLDLSWHALAPTALASASADHTAGIWDLSEGKQVLSLPHSEKVQTLDWHPKESSVLLTGAFDHVVRLFDCRHQTSSCLKWKIKGEVERVLWDQFSPFNFFASDDSGHIHYMDSRKDKKSIFTLQAHTSAVTGLSQCQDYNGCLVTVAMDSLLKVWDIFNQKPSCILEKKFKDQGGLTCVGTCPEASSILVLGSEKCLTIYDLMDSNQARKHFEKKNSTDVQSKAIDEAMDELNLNTMDYDEDELNEYLGNIAEAPKNDQPLKSKANKHQNRKKKMAKRKSKK